MSESKKPDITIIGAGAVGATLTLALHQLGYEIKGVYNRTASKAEEIGTLVNTSHKGTFPEELGGLGDVTFICVPDDEIEGTGKRIHDKFPEVKDRIFTHCSGVKPASALHHLKDSGAQIAAFQPIQTFLKDYHKNSFTEVPISLQGDEHALDVLKKIAIELGAKPFFISEKDKILLHAAAVFACNYMTTITEAARIILSATGIEEDNSLSLLKPLMDKTLHNIETKGPAASLSGPIKRGDLSTIQSHLNALKDFPDLRTLYGTMGRNTVELFAGHLNPDQNIVKKMSALLSDAEKS